MRNANFSHADVSGASFCNADPRGVNWEGVIYNNSTSCFPDEAINCVSTTSNNPNDNNNNPGHNCPNSPSVSNPNTRSLTEDLDSVKRNVNTVKDLLNLF